MRRALHHLGVILAVLGLVFVLVRLARDWPALRLTLRQADLLVLLVAFLAAGAGMVAVALGWHLALRLSLPSGRVPPLPVTVRLYFLGEVAKYVPGSVWAVVGRAELLRQRGVRRLHAYGSVALSLAAFYLAGAALTVLWGLARPLGDLGRAGWGAAALLVVGAVALLHHRVLTLAVGLVERLAGRELPVVIPPWSGTLLLVSSYLPAWALLGGATWLVARSLGGAAPFLPLLFATALSWLVGFLVVPAPGGLGVREAAFVVAASPLLGPAAPAVALVARLLVMIVDLAGALLSVRAGQAGRS